MGWTRFRCESAVKNYARGSRIWAICFLCVGVIIPVIALLFPDAMTATTEEVVETVIETAEEIIE